MKGVRDDRRARSSSAARLKRIGRRKGVLEGFVERLFLAPTLIAIAIVLTRFAFRIGDHFGFSGGADKDLAMTQISVRCSSSGTPFASSGCRKTYSWRHVHRPFSFPNAPAEALEFPSGRRGSSPTSTPSRRHTRLSGARARARRRSHPPWFKLKRLYPQFE